MSRYVTVIRDHGSSTRWVMARRVGEVIEHVPLNSRELDAAVIEARKKAGRGVKVIVPRRGDKVPS